MRGLALLLLVGCVTEQVSVTPRELLHRVRELRITGHAHVSVGNGDTYDLSADRVFDVTLHDKPATITLRQMIDGCPEIVPFAGQPGSPTRCLLLDTTVERFRIDTRHHVNWEIFEVFGGALLVTATLGAIAGLVCHASASGC